LCAQEYGSCLWQHAVPKIYFTHGSIFKASCNPDLVEALDLSGCGKDPIGDLYDFRNIKTLKFGSEIGKFPKSLLTLEKVTNLDMAALRLPNVLNLSHAGLERIPSFFQDALIANKAPPSVETIDLSGNALSSESLANFFLRQTEQSWTKHVRFINIKSNKAHFLPSAILFHWKKLESIDMRGNRIRGLAYYEAEWAKAGDGRSIRAENNPLDFVIFPSSKLEKTIFAVLGGADFAALSSTLRTLEISDNQIGGEIPKGIFAAINLTRIGLNRNNMNGTLPAEFGIFKTCEHLHLQDNAFEGTLPTELALLTNLKALQLQNNAFEGTIPPQFARLTALTKLSLSGNPNLDASSVPQTLANVTEL